MPDWSDFVPELACLGVDLVITAVLCKCYENANKVVRDLNSAAQVNVDSGLKDVIRSHPEAVTDEATDTVTLPYVALRGIVNPLGGRSVTSLYSQRAVEGVIQRVVFTQHGKKMYRGMWMDTKRTLNDMTNHVPFCLADSNYGLGLFSAAKPFVEVMDWKEAARVDLETVHDEFVSHSATIGQHLWDHIIEGEMTRGVQKTETMLTNGAAITGVGKLVLGPMGVKLLPPEDGKSFFLVDSLKSLVKEQEQNRNFHKILVYMFSGLGLFIGGYMAWKYLNIRKREGEVRVNQDTLAEIVRGREVREARTGDREERELPDRLVCVVCLGAEREVILLPCGHVCVCATCADTLLQRGDTCPVCRGRIRTVMPAYLS